MLMQSLKYVFFYFFQIKVLGWIEFGVKRFGAMYRILNSRK